MRRVGKGRKTVDEIRVIEELFFDELTHKVSSMFRLFEFSFGAKREVESFVDQLTTITEENIQLLCAYESK